MKESDYVKIMKVLAILGTLYFAFFNFSLESRQKIWQRDEAKCRRCFKTKRRGYYLEVSHLNHDRSYQYYDSPSNGILVCLADHLAEHRRMEGRNGLSVEDNRRAIMSIQARMKQKTDQGVKI